MNTLSDRQLKPAPRGMVLAVTIVVLLLISLMGAAIMLRTQVEVSTTGNTVQGRDAFTRADAAVRVATVLTQILLAADGINDRNVKNAIRAQAEKAPAGHEASAFTVEPNEKTFNEPDLVTSDARVSFARRYLRAGRTDGSEDEKPDIVIKKRAGETILATAVVSRDFERPDQAAGGGQMAGASAGIRQSGSSDTILLIEKTYAITVAGRPLTASGGDYLGAGDSSLSPDDRLKALKSAFGPNSIITVLYRHI